MSCGRYAVIFQYISPAHTQATVAGTPRVVSD